MPGPAGYDGYLAPEYEGPEDEWSGVPESIRFIRETLAMLQAAPSEWENVSVADSRNESNRSPDGAAPGGRWRYLLAGLAATAAFMVVLRYIAPLSGVMFDSDEGQEVAKALLFSKGYMLYSQIWSDQPPLMSVLLTAWFNIWGFSMPAARMMSVAFSAALLAALYGAVAAGWDRLTGVCAVVLLILSHDYLRLSRSVMIGGPSLGFLMISLWLLFLYVRRPGGGRLALSGAFFALSLQTKLFTLFLCPLYGLMIVFVEWRRRKPGRRVGWVLTSGLLLGSALVVTFAAVSFFWGTFDVRFLVMPHAKSAAGLHGYTLSRTMGTGLVRDSAGILLAEAGIVILIRQRRLPRLLPAAWLAMSFVLLWFHRPAWYHQYLLLSIPMAWLAAVGLARLIRLARSESAPGGQRVAARALVALIALVLCGRAVLIYNDLNWRGFAMDEKALAIMRKYAPETKWVATNEGQLYVVCAGMLPPPELAVTGMKRIASGALSVRDFLNVIREYHPGQVVLETRATYDPQLMWTLGREYSELYRGRAVRVFVRKDLVREEGSSRGG